MIEFTVGLIVTCIASVSKLARISKGKRFGSFFGASTDPRGSVEGHAEEKPRRNHFPDGLSGLDSMRTFGTTVDSESQQSTSLDPPHATSPVHSSVGSVQGKYWSMYP